MSYNKLATITLPKHIKPKTYFLNVETLIAESSKSSTTPPLSMQLILIFITKSSNINNNNIIEFPTTNHKLEKENTVVVFASSIKFLAHHETAIATIVHEWKD